MAADMKILLAEFASMREEIVGLKAALESSKTKVKKEKRVSTNVEGPAAWNVFVKDTQKTMAAAVGVDSTSMDEAAFKKAASAKDSGFGWQAALKEASRCKAALEGRDPDAPKPAALAKKAASAASEPKAPVKAAPKVKDAAAEALVKAEAEFKELNLAEMEINGKSYYINQDCYEVYEIASQWVIGERLGVYDFETDSIDVFQ